jgi:hypothetical protein
MGMVVWIALSPDLRASSYGVGSEAMAHPFGTASRPEVLSKEDVDGTFGFVKWREFTATLEVCYSLPNYTLLCSVLQHAIPGW